MDQHINTGWWVPEGSAQIRFDGFEPPLLSAWGYAGPDHALARRLVDHLNATGFTPEEGTGMNAHTSNKAVHADIQVPTPPDVTPRYVASERSSQGDKCAVRDRRRGLDVALCWEMATAQRIARLLNEHDEAAGAVPDVSCKHPSEAEWGALRAKVEHLAAELDEVNKNLRTTSRHYAKVKAERDEARENARLKAEVDALMMSYYCIDCGWVWPLPGDLPVGAECDNCGGELEADDKDNEEAE